MAGIAIKIIGADYSASGFGRVTLKGSIVPIESINISGEAIIMDSGQFLPILFPSNTTQVNVIWSIISGNSYASIDQNGLLTVLDGANNSSVTIKCESAENSEVFATKTVAVTKQTQLVSDGLIRNYDAFGSSSTTLDDLSGQGNGTISFAGARGTNTIGNNKITAPATDPYFHPRNLANTNWLNGLSQWTLEYVVHMDGWANNSILKDLFHDASGEGPAKHVIYMSPDGTYCKNNGGVLCRKSTSQWGYVEWEDSVLNINWSVPHILHITREPDDTKYSFKLYIDGSYFTKAEGQIDGMRASYSQRADFLMAESKPTSGLSASRSMYAIRCYNRALSAAEVARNYEYNVNRYGFSMTK